MRRKSIVNERRTMYTLADRHMSNRNVDFLGEVIIFG